MAHTLPFSTMPFASSSGSSLSQIHGGPRMCGVARRARSVGIVRMTKDENEVELVVETAKEMKMVKTNGDEEEPFLLRIGVAFVTEILRVFSSFGSSQTAIVVEEVIPAAAVENRSMVQILREDYERAYFLTGEFTTLLYDDNCLFADPTIQFRGRDKYQRNLKLLVPFFEEPQLTLFDIQEEDSKDEENERSINANWNLRTYLRLPWKPLINVNGSTLYVVGANSKIVEHIESWSLSAREAVQQIFVPSDRAFQRKKS